MYLRELIEELIRYDIDYPDDVKVPIEVCMYDIEDREPLIVLTEIDFIGGRVILS